MLKRILVGLGDLAFSTSATRTALNLATAHDASLTAVTLVDPSHYASGPIPIGGGEAAKELREHRLQLTAEIIDQSIDHFERACRQENVNFTVARETGDAFECMVDRSRYHDLAVCGLRNLFDHGVLDEPPHELVRLGEGGVRPIVAVGPEYNDINRILVAYSGSSESARTMKRFAQMNLWPDCQVRVVTFDNDQGVGEERLEEAKEYLLEHKLDAETEWVDGHAKEHLQTYATGWDADLIVMGNSARKFFIKRLFGETMMNLIESSEVPLFLGQ